MNTTKKAKNKYNYPLYNIFDVGGNISGAIGDVANIVATAKKAATIYPNGEDSSLIEAVENYKPDSTSLDELSAEYNSSPWLDTYYNYKDYLPNVGEQIGNVFGGISSGLSAGMRSGNPYVAAAGAVLGGGIAGMGIGAGIGKAKYLAYDNQIRSIRANENKRLNTEAAKDSILRREANNIYKSIAAYGGPLFNLSGDFSNGVTFINNGGTHEENPYDGVPMGVDKEGTPNLVEEGEVIVNGYVLSNRIKATKELLEEYGLPTRYEDLSIARVAEKLNEESAERPNDTISKRGLNNNMNKLMALQEKIRSTRKQGKTNRFDLGGDAQKLLDETALALYNNAINENLDSGFGDIKIEPINVGNMDYTAPFIIDSNGRIPLSKDYIRRIKKGTNSNNAGTVSSIGRYIPILANTANLLSNVFQKPDYSEGYRPLEVAKTAPKSNIVANLKNIRLKRTDPNYLVNTLLNNSNTLLSSIDNNAEIGQQAFVNKMLANKQAGEQIADALLKVEEANATKALQEAEFNRNNETIRTQTGFQNHANNMQALQQLIEATKYSSAYNTAVNEARAKGILDSASAISEDAANMASEKHWGDIIDNLDFLMYNRDGSFKVPKESKKKKEGKTTMTR